MCSQHHDNAVLFTAETELYCRVPYGPDATDGEPVHLRGVGMRDCVVAAGAVAACGKPLLGLVSARPRGAKIATVGYREVLLCLEHCCGTLTMRDREGAVAPLLRVCGARSPMKGHKSTQPRV